VRMAGGVTGVGTGAGGTSAAGEVSGATAGAGASLVGAAGEGVGVELGVGATDGVASVVGVADALLLWVALLGVTSAVGSMLVQAVVESIRASPITPVIAYFFSLGRMGPPSPGSD